MDNNTISYTNNPEFDPKYPQKYPREKIDTIAMTAGFKRKESDFNDHEGKGFPHLT